MEETAMSEKTDNSVTAALTFAVPQRVGWSVQHEDQSWTGSDLAGLIDYLAKEGPHQKLTLSLSLIFEFPGNDGTVRS